MSYLSVSVAVSEFAASQTAEAVRMLGTGALRPLSALASNHETIYTVDTDAASQKFWDSGMGAFLRTLAGIGAFILVVWGFIKAVMEAAKGRGGGVGQILKQVMPMFIFAAALALITIIPRIALTLFVWPIREILEFFEDEVNEAENNQNNKKPATTTPGG